MGGLLACAAAGLGRHRKDLTKTVLLGIITLGLILPARVASTINSSLGLCYNVVHPWGYPCTEYTVETEDGFLLGVQNIPYGVNQPPNRLPRKPVFLMHGILNAGDNWVFNQPSESLGYILADAGYDVWIGNNRATQWSHGHASLTTEDEFPYNDSFGDHGIAISQYDDQMSHFKSIAYNSPTSDLWLQKSWEWSWDEMAAYDLPAMIGLVYNRTNSQKVSYVGHSQGTTLLLAGVLGEYDHSAALTSMLAKAVLLCPIAYLGNVSSTFDRVASDVYLDQVLQTFGVSEFNLGNEAGKMLIQHVCGTPGVNCTDIFKAVAGNYCCLNYTRAPYYLNFYPQRTSTKNLGHFAQSIRSGTFSKYDYSLLGNIRKYKQLHPPKYELADFPTSLSLMIVQGGQDELADPMDVQKLVDELGPKVTKRVSVERYAHGDFIVSYTANVDIYPQITGFLENPIP